MYDSPTELGSDDMKLLQEFVRGLNYDPSYKPLV